MPASIARAPVSAISKRRWALVIGFVHQATGSASATERPPQRAWRSDPVRGVRRGEDWHSRTATLVIRSLSGIPATRLLLVVEADAHRLSRRTRNLLKPAEVLKADQLRWR